jgi:hypothetical protein
MRNDLKAAARLVRYEPTMWCDSTLRGWATVRFDRPMIISRVACLRVLRGSAVIIDAPSCISFPNDHERLQWEQDVLDALADGGIAP